MLQGQTHAQGSCREGAAPSVGVNRAGDYVKLVSHEGANPFRKTYKETITAGLGPSDFGDDVARGAPGYSKLKT